MLEVELEKYLSCPICKGIVEDPVTLQCHHTYCRRCIADYIKSRSDAGRERSIPCALKCEETKVPDPKKPPEDWAHQLKPSFIISNLVDDYHKTAGRECTRCNRNNARVLAVKWCQNCRQSLCENCIYSHERDPTTHLHLVTDLPQRSEKQPQPYPIKENISTEKNLLERKIEEVSTSIATNRSRYDLLVLNQRTQQERVRDVFTKIKDFFKIKETMLLRELDDAAGKELIMIQDALLLEENCLQLYQQNVHLVEKAETSGSFIDMYRMCDALLRDECSDNNKQPMCNHVRFHINSDELMKQLKGLDFGTIQILGESDSKRLGKFKPSGTIEYRLSKDKEMPYIHDITVLEIEDNPVLVVTDCSNNCVKSFYTRNNKTRCCRLPMSNPPKGITQLMGNVMVAVPEAREIRTVAVTPDLIRLSVIHTRESYISLTVVGSTSLAAGGDDCVDILNMKGEVMKSISKHTNTAEFASPWHMCVSITGCLLVSDWVKRRVTCLTREGNVAWMYTGTGEEELRSPEGITATSTGYILVADSNLKKVIQLSESGEYVGDVLTSKDDLGHTEGICVDKHGSLFVCDLDKVKKYSSVQI